MLPFAGHAQVEVRGEQLLRQQDDLARVHFQMAHHLEDGLEDCAVAPCAVRLRVDDAQQTFGVERGNHGRRFLQRGIEGRPSYRRMDRGRQRKLIIALPHVRLIVDSMQNPLPHVAFQMQQQVANGVS